MTDLNKFIYIRNLNSSTADLYWNYFYSIKMVEVATKPLALQYAMDLLSKAHARQLAG